MIIELLLAFLASNLISFAATRFAVESCWCWQGGGFSSSLLLSSSSSSAPEDTIPFVSNSNSRRTLASNCCKCVDPARESAIIDLLSFLVPENLLNDESTVQAQAADWIVRQDPMQLSEHDVLEQRYLLALFCLSTTQSKPWAACNPPSAPNDSPDCTYDKLLKLFPETITEETPANRWLSSAHECDWLGVLCDEFDQIRALTLIGQEIQGTLPSEIALFPYLQSIELFANQFSGTLPTELGGMKHILNIEFHLNYFSGQVPLEWFQLPLQRLNILGNFLTGTVPTEIGQLTNLKGFFLFENLLTGTIPTQVGLLRWLAFTRWSRNFLSGTVPTEFGLLTKLNELWLHRNELTGQQPSELGNLQRLGDIRLHFNQLTGTIPEGVYKLPQLSRYDIYDNQFTGTISTEIGLVSTLQNFRVSNNNFNGTVPTEIGKLEKLEQLWLHGNAFTGSIPFSVCALRGDNPAAFGAGLESLIADCGPTNALIECPDDTTIPCCTSCCDGVTQVCDGEE